MERVEPVLTDQLFAAFVASLPAALADPALGLAVTLGLAPSREVPWSQVFSNEVTLGAPALVAEAMPAVPPATVRSASLAHLLAILDAFATDRVEDGQAAATPELAALLAHTRAARDLAVAQVGGDGGPAYAIAERETLAAIAAEQRVFRKGETVTFERYLAISHGKQRVGLPASLALARAAGWDGRRARALAHLLDAVWLGLQLHDDVLDWEDDLARGGAWAVWLARSTASRTNLREAPTVPISIKQVVHQSGILARMLAAAARRFRAARRRAAALGAHRLSAWAREREAVTAELARRETDTPGYTHRAHALSAWAKTVLP